MDERVMADFDDPPSSVSTNPWDAWRRFTHARSSLPTAPLLAFNLSHAQARDAVHQPLDVAALHASLRASRFDTLDVESAAPDRDHYLRRPDLGRKLNDESTARLRDYAASAPAAFDVVFVV